LFTVYALILDSSSKKVFEKYDIIDPKIAPSISSISKIIT